ncbi:MAG: hypothetical protein K0R18_512 [Bacillales bacterium]|jgi:hypothetical protein|nr:hypothetical protein [Bacillales bacterium]
MIDIYCKDGLCPICNSELQKIKVPMGRCSQCKNGCYEFHVDNQQNGGYNVDRFWVFKHQRIVPLMSNKSIQNMATNQLIDNINYWKENDRYLMKIMNSV